MKNTVYMEEMDAFTYRDKLAQEAVMFIPVGALEQHGSHMAMCVDAALTKAMAGATAEALVADTEGAVEGVVCALINFAIAPSSAAAAASTVGHHIAGHLTLISLARDICYTSSRTALARSCS
ncbi:MAG: creatininase family protein [Adlercreutzia sp.]